MHCTNTSSSACPITHTDSLAFSYNIGSLHIDPTPNELCDAFHLVSRSVTRMSIWPMLQFFFPLLRMLVCPHALILLTIYSLNFLRRTA